VVKNTLTRIAAREAGVTAFDGLLVGPSAIAFVKGDPVEAAKGLRDFAKAHPLLVIKGGVLDGNPLSVDEIKKLADLESREVLLAKLAGAMNASLQNACRCSLHPWRKPLASSTRCGPRPSRTPASWLEAPGLPRRREQPAGGTPRLLRGTRDARLRQL
jgi:hypothetical protein